MTDIYIEKGRVCHFKTRSLTFCKSMIYLMIAFYTGFTKLIPSDIFQNLIFYFLWFTGIIAFFTYTVNKGIRSTGMWLLAYCLIFPIYGSIKSYLIFDQPVLLGVVSLRYLSFILIGYLFILCNYPYKSMIDQINKYNLFIASVSIFLILILQIPGSSLDALFYDTNHIERMSSSMERDFSIRGQRFTQCSALMLLSYIYYLFCLLKYGFVKKYLLPFLVLMVYLLFVNKGRQPLAVMAIVYMVYYLHMYRLTMKKFFLTILPILCVLFIILFQPEFLYRFTTILDADRSQDFSTLARIESITSVFPYIKENFIFGIGNLSSHFREYGFQQYFGRFFYMSDIGIFGTIARGGIILIIIYVGMYISLWRNTKRVSNLLYRDYMRYMLISFFILLTLFCGDILVETGSSVFGLIFYPLFDRKRTPCFIY